MFYCVEIDKCGNDNDKFLGVDEEQGN